MYKSKKSLLEVLDMLTNTPDMVLSEATETEKAYIRFFDYNTDPCTEYTLVIDGDRIEVYSSVKE